MNTFVSKLQKVSLFKNVGHWAFTSFVLPPQGLILSLPAK